MASDYCISQPFIQPNQQPTFVPIPSWQTHSIEFDWPDIWKRRLSYFSLEIKKKKNYGERLRGWANWKTNSVDATVTVSGTQHSGETSYSHIQLYRPFPTNPPAKYESAGEKEKELFCFFLRKKKIEEMEPWQTRALEAWKRKVGSRNRSLVLER